MIRWLVCDSSWYLWSSILDLSQPMQRYNELMGYKWMHINFQWIQFSYHKNLNVRMEMVLIVNLWVIKWDYMYNGENVPMKLFPGILPCASCSLASVLENTCETTGCTGLSEPLLVTFAKFFFKVRPKLRYKKLMCFVNLQGLHGHDRTASLLAVNAIKMDITFGFIIIYPYSLWTIYYHT